MRRDGVFVRGQVNGWTVTVKGVGMSGGWELDEDRVGEYGLVIKFNV